MLPGMQLAMVICQKTMMDDQWAGKHAAEERLEWQSIKKKGKKRGQLELTRNRWDDPSSSRVVPTAAPSSSLQGSPARVPPCRLQTDGEWKGNRRRMSGQPVRRCDNGGAAGPTGGASADLSSNRAGVSVGKFTSWLPLSSGKEEDTGRRSTKGGRTFFPNQDNVRVKGQLQVVDFIMDLITLSEPAHKWPSGKGRRSSQWPSWQPAPGERVWLWAEQRGRRTTLSSQTRRYLTIACYLTPNTLGQRKKNTVFRL